MKSEFRQIPPDRLQLLYRMAFVWAICLSTIEQSVAFNENAEPANWCVPAGLFLRLHRFGNGSKAFVNRRF